jgi:hypothetical protein
MARSLTPLFLMTSAVLLVGVAAHETRAEPTQADEFSVARLRSLGVLVRYGRQIDDWVWRSDRTVLSLGDRDALAHRVVWVTLSTRRPNHEKLCPFSRRDTSGGVRHHLDGQQANEIAAATGRPLGTVTKQLSRAMSRLRRWAAEEGISDE